MGSTSTTDAYALAEAKFLKGDFEGARETLDAALSVDADAGQLWELLGMVAYADSDINGAVDALERASMFVPLANCSQFVLALGYEKQHRDEPAYTIYRHLAAQRNLDDNLLEPVARALGRFDDCQGALNVCRLAARRSPDTTEPLMGMVFYMQRLGRPTEQILPVLFQSLHLDPEDNDCRLATARALHDCSRHEEAAYLLSQMPIESCRCPSCLNSMQMIFAAACDEESLSRCLAAQQALEEEAR
ncbi:MAG: hypothetical protein AAGD11_19845 [Planctomycetota bacterium]